jgi:hypothetical protein
MVMTELLARTYIPYYTGTAMSYGTPGLTFDENASGPK